MLRQTLILGGEHLPVLFISGIYTPPEHRNRGFASARIREVIGTASKAVFLVPEKPDLFAFYNRLGFQPFFTVTRRIVTRRPGNWPALSEADPEETLRFYRRELRGQTYIRRTPTYFEELRTRYRFCGVRGEGYAVLKREPDGWVIQEAMGNDPLLAQAVLQELGLPAITVITPGPTTPVGLAYWKIPPPEGTGYCNLLPE